MRDEELKAQARTTAPNIEIAAGLWVMGGMIVMISAVAWIVLAVMAGDFFSNTMAVRTGAEAGSGILSQLGSIEAVKLWVLPLAFVGLASFLLGFGFAFANILRNIRLRGNTMAAVLPQLKQHKAGR